jgi:hypothetical protein
MLSPELFLFPSMTDAHCIPRHSGPAGKRMSRFDIPARSVIARRYCRTSRCPHRTTSDEPSRSVIFVWVFNRSNRKGARARHKARSFFERYNIVSECDLVDTAKKRNVLHPAARPPEGGSHTSDRGYMSDRGELPPPNVT